MRHISSPASQLTPDQEREIRRSFFKEKLSPEVICDRFKISTSKLRSLVAGPLTKQNRAIEKVYN